MTDQDVSLGEMTRSLNRIEVAVQNLSSQVQSAMTLGAGHSILIAANAAELDKQQTKIDSLVTRSAYISGGIAAIMSALNYFFFGRGHA